MTGYERTTIEGIVDDMKRAALCAGHYAPPHTATAYDKRNKRAAFRSIGYNRYVRQINVLCALLARDRLYSDIRKKGGAP